MKVLLLREGFYPKIGGGSIEQWSVARQLTARGHEVTVFTPRRTDAPSRETVEGIEIHRPFGAAEHLQSGPTSFRGFVGRLLFSIRLALTLALWVRTEDVDVVYSASHLTHPPAKVLSGLYGLPVVNYVAYTPTMDEGKRTFTHPSYLLEQLNFRLFMGDVVCCRVPVVESELRRHTDAAVELVHGILDPSEIRDAETSADTEAIRRRFGVGPDEYLVLFVGRFVPVKNVPLAIDIFATLSPEYRLVLFGDGPGREAVRARVSEHGVGERVTLAGEVSHEEVLRTMVAADALVVTSRTEAYPTAVFEALVLGNDVFAPPVGVLPVTSHPHLHVADYEALPELIRETPLGGAHRVDEPTLRRFSMDRFVEQLLGTFESLAGARSSSESRSVGAGADNR